MGTIRDLRPRFRSSAAQLVLIAALSLALRVPFLFQAVQGDDYYYLAGAMHALIDPAHPTHVRYVFLGQEVDARGHPHPPLNMWILAGLLAWFGDVREVPFHLAYAVFTLIAACGMFDLARRFSSRPLLACLMFLSVPAFVVNGNSFESDLPLLAFWIASVALFVRAVESASRMLLAGAAVSLGLAGLLGFQALVLIPILGWWLWHSRRKWLAAWLAVSTPLITALGWQVFERLTSGEWPLVILAGHFESFGFQRLQAKLANIVGLTTHLGWMVCPVLVWRAFSRSPRWAVVLAALGGLLGAFALDEHPLFWLPFATGILASLSVVGTFPRMGRGERFLGWWFLVFLVASYGLFFSGSARYLLPLSAPLAVLVANRLEKAEGRWWWPWVGGQFVLSLALALVNYQHWDGYRQLVAELQPLFATRRVWVNGEWGLRYYAEAVGGLPLREAQPVQPGELVLTSELGFPVTFTTGGGSRQLLRVAEIHSWLPFRLIGLAARSAYSTVAFGYRAFDLTLLPIDRVRVELVTAREPQMSYLLMNAPGADEQIVSGVYQLEDGRFRWMAARAVFLLKAPEQPSVLEVSLYRPPQAPARAVRVAVEGRAMATMELPGPGSYVVRSSRPIRPDKPVVHVEITVDRTFSPPGDRRELGIILTAVGLRPLQ